MVNMLVGLHAALGELGALLFLWVLIEIIEPSTKRINRAKIISVMGLILILSAWFVAGSYYTTTYGQEVKPIIKAGPEPWAHDIFTETKEHVFLFLPFLSLLATCLIFK